MSLLQLACEEGTQDYRLAYLMTYARYLNNGGTPEGWMTLNSEDVAMMCAVHYSDMKAMLKAQSISIANAVGKMLAGEQDGQ